MPAYLESYSIATSMPGRSKRSRPSCATLPAAEQPTNKGGAEEMRSPQVCSRLVEAEAAAAQQAHLEIAVSALLAGLGEDITRDGIRETPKRVAKALMFAARGYQLSPAEELGTAQFPEETVELGASHKGNLVLVGDIELFSTHEVDMMPFYGRAHVAYIPRPGCVVGLSKFARITEVYARRLQTPARLASELVEALHTLIEPQGLAVVIESTHMSHFGQVSPRTVNTAARGCLSAPAELREVMVLLNKQDGGTVASNGNGSDTRSPGPSPGKVYQKSTTSSAKARARHAARPVMEQAAAQLLEAMLYSAAPRPELRAFAPHNFVSNMLASTRGAEAELPDLVWPALADTARYHGGGGGEGPALCIETFLPVQSLCEHHLLPFRGTAHIAYLPGAAGPLPRAVLEQIVSTYSMRLQVQERLTRQIAHAVGALTAVAGGSSASAAALDGINNQECNMGTATWGVVVVVQAGHMCMVARGVQNSTTLTTTRVMLGAFTADAEARLKVLQQIPNKQGVGSAFDGSWD